jgi:ligand-binding sensor domain-containing protein/serine phosphatase RsbU (regulator of sigma subunit)
MKGIPLAANRVLYVIDIPRRLLRQWGATLVLLFFSTITAVPAAIAQHNYMFDHVGVKQGLSQGTVYCILQDSQGFIWLGTQDGLNRFDGYDFQVFKNDPMDPKSLNYNWVLALAEAADGTLLVQTLNFPDVWNRFDRLTETFSQVPRDSVSLAGARVSSVFQGYVDRDGIKWSRKGSGGLTRLDTRTKEITLFKHDPANPNCLIDNKVYSVAGDQKGNIWITTAGGLDRYDPASGIFRHYRHDPKNPSSLSNNWVWPVLVDNAGTVWVGGYEGGLNKYDPKTDSFVRFSHNESNPRSLNDNAIKSLYQDRSGVVWIGTGDVGVDRFHPDMSFFKHYLHDPADRASLTNNTIIGLYVDRSGTPWIGTRGGLDRFDRTTNRFTHYAHNPTNPNSISDNIAYWFLEDREGTFWIGTENGGLNRLDQRTGKFTHYMHDPANPASISDNDIYALLEDHTGAFWVGTYSGGLNLFDRASGTFTAYRHSDSVASSLGADGVWALCEDHERILWVGTSGGGLDKFDRASGTFVHFKNDESNPKSLSNNTIYCIHEDRNGTLWVATQAGLNKLDRASGSFKHYGEKEGFPNEVMFSIVEDGRGFLWISTNRGLSRFNPREETVKSFGYSDGLQGNEFNQAAYALDPRTGEMYFGGSNGLTIFHPDSIRENAFVPPIVFSSFARYNTDDKEGRALNVPGISAREAITLSYKDNIANIEIAALNFYNTAKNQYAYKLEGFGDNWIQLGNERRATFTNLDAGEYTLRVKGSNNDGIWNNEGTALHVTVTPPWWKTRWAYGTYAVLVLAFLYGIRTAEIKRREQKAQIRESQLHAKAAEAEKRALQAENERKSKELEDARQLQFSMLPKDVPKLPQYDISVFMKTATEVGGDYYDFSTGQDGTLNIAFGDATGHGMQAGTIVTLMKGLFISDATRFDIQTFFNHCSKAIKDIKLGRLFMAFTMVRLQGRQAMLSTAGMPPVFLYRCADGTVEEILMKGMPLGAMKNFPYAVHDTELRPGDTMVLLTDGLPEQKNGAGEMFDYGRVKDVITATGARPPKDIIDALAREGDTWMAGISQDDDITIMAIKMKG